MPLLSNKRTVNKESQKTHTHTYFANIFLRMNFSSFFDNTRNDQLSVCEWKFMVFVCAEWCSLIRPRTKRIQIGFACSLFLAWSNKIQTLIFLSWTFLARNFGMTLLFCNMNFQLETLHFLTFKPTEKNRNYKSLSEQKTF